MPKIRALKIPPIGHPVLRGQAKTVPAEMIKSPGFQKLVQRMIDTMRRAPGVGLAAPQVGLPLRLAVIEVTPDETRWKRKKNFGPLAIINPEITSRSRSSSKDWEGCLSVPKLRGIVSRSKKITVKYTDISGRSKKLICEGFLARVFQHEIDHLDGKVYLDRMTDFSSLASD